MGFPVLDPLDDPFAAVERVVRAHRLGPGGVDAILVDGGVAEQYAAANPDLVIAAASSELPAAEPYCIAVAKGDPKGLLDGINAALAKMASENKIETFIADADALADVAVEVSAD